MSETIETTAIEVAKPSATPALFDLAPEAKVEFVTKMANVLKDVIEKQKFYVELQGKKYVKVDGWISLGTLLGILPREKSVTELPDGSYVADVELVRFDTGKVVAGASSLCSVDEKRWKTADKYARRSMATTRATGKAYRLAFSWVVNMAGYEATPAEEMPEEVKAKPEVIFDPQNKKHLDALGKQLKERNVLEQHWDAIAVKLAGKPTSHLDAIVRDTLV